MDRIIKLKSFLETYANSGQKVLLKIYGKVLECEITKEDRTYFALQNTFDGCSADNKKEYKYSWALSNSSGGNIGQDWDIVEIEPLEKDGAIYIVKKEVSEKNGKHYCLKHGDVVKYLRPRKSGSGYFYCERLKKEVSCAFERLELKKSIPFSVLSDIFTIPKTRAILSRK